MLISNKNVLLFEMDIVDEVKDVLTVSVKEHVSDSIVLERISTMFCCINVPKCALPPDFGEN